MTARPRAVQKWKPTTEATRELFDLPGYPLELAYGQGVEPCPKCPCELLEGYRAVDKVCDECECHAMWRRFMSGPEAGLKAPWNVG